LIIKGLNFFKKCLYLLSQFFEGKLIASLLFWGLEAAYFNDNQLGLVLVRIMKLA
jgi:hypothetical protein